MSGESKEGSPLIRPGFARRFGGYFLPFFSRPETQPVKTAVELAVDRENDIIDQRQRAHYHTNLFRETRASVFGNNAGTTQGSLNRLRIVRDELFEKELASLHTIADRFILFADPFYESFINNLDLGETKQPGSHEEVTALKEEYHQLLRLLEERGVIDGELSRTEAKPTIHLSFNADSDFVTATRNRELLSFIDGGRELSVAKRMTFLMPQSVLQSTQVSDHGGLRRSQVTFIEKLIDKQDPEKIIPVRTVYYAKSKPLKKTDD